MPDTLHPFAKSITQEQAAHLLVTPSALIELSMKDARQVVTYMRPKRIQMGTEFIHEGERAHTDYMMLILQGDVTVESVVPGEKDNMVVSVIGPGNLIGEMGVLDGAPRSASCTAATDLAVAVLSRAAMLRLVHAQPAVAARLMLAVSKRLADRLRDTTRKLKRFAQINSVLQAEIHSIMDNRSGAHVLKLEAPARGHAVT